MSDTNYPLASGDALPGPRVAIPPEVARRLIELFLAGRKPRTLEAYSDDLGDFRAFLGVATVDDAARVLLGRGSGEGNATLLDYRAHLVDRGLAPATVNRRLAAVRALVKLAKLLGLVPWTLDVQGLRVEKLKDTRGPGPEGVAALLAEAERRADAKGARDCAALRLLHDLALRRAEVVSLDLEHLDVAAGTVSVLGKGKLERVALTLPPKTSAALQAWLAVRGTGPGPLLTSFDRARKGSGRLTPGSLYRVVRSLGERTNVRARPHGIRHTAITKALDVSGGDLRASAAFSRHADWRTLAKYDDNRRDLAGEVAKKISDSL